MLDTNNVRELADPRLGDDYDPIEMKRTMLTASICIHHQSSKRPYMNKVWNSVFHFHVSLILHTATHQKMTNFMHILLLPNIGT